MRRELRASLLVEEVLAGSFSPYPTLQERILGLFAGVPLDFPVIITDRLPFRLDRRRMIGVTIRGRVWILSSWLDRPALHLLALLRHEAEHVRQQRRSPLGFYPRYVGGWLCNLLRGGSAEIETSRSLIGRMHHAYRGIPDERSAYLAGRRFLLSLRREIRRSGLDPQNF